MFLNNCRAHKSPRQYYTNQVKLSSSLLHQLNPNLTSEQKLSRTIDQVEKWLECDHLSALKKTVEDGEKLNNHRINMNDHNKTEKFQKSVPKKIDNILATDQLKITEDIVTNDVVSTEEGCNNENLVRIKKMEKNNVQTEKNQLNVVKEYANIAVQAELSECEKLLHEEVSDEEPLADNSTSSDSMIQKHLHIHHHYHHLNF